MELRVKSGFSQFGAVRFFVKEFISSECSDGVCTHHDYIDNWWMSVMAVTGKL
jgi:hypothetical protein